MAIEQWWKARQCPLLGPMLIVAPTPPILKVQTDLPDNMPENEVRHANLADMTTTGACLSSFPVTLCDSSVFPLYAPSFDYLLTLSCILNYKHSPTRSPPRKRFKNRSPRRWEHDYVREPPRGRYRDQRDDRRRGPYGGRPYRERSPSPERLRREQREERDRRT